MDIRYLKGVGEKNAHYLNLLGIKTVEDAIYYFPRDYEDRQSIKKIKDLKDGEIATLIVEVALINGTKKTQSGKRLTSVVFKDDTGYITGIWFNQPYMKKTFKVGEKVLLYGKINRRYAELQIVDPKYEKNYQESLEVGENILPLYPLNKYMTQKNLRKIIKNALDKKEDVVQEILPQKLLRDYKLLDIYTAIENIHFPESKYMLDKSIYRLKFEELFILQLGLQYFKKSISSDLTAYPIQLSDKLKDLKEALPFELTNAQSRAVREILLDMKKNKPMNRLVQGDVGSGKTVIAAIAMFNCAMAGYQAAMLAPTEILAEQHYHSVKSLLDRFGLNIELITGSTSKKQKEKILEALLNGEIDIIIGTHALLQENVEFKNLALVVTDEQHRFGVRQRSSLISKGHNPHVLVMTATPIPRTLALFLYGDMDISIINELPKGRQKIDTYFVRSTMRERVYNFIKKEVEEGKQAYIVCPLVEESEKIEAISAEEAYEYLVNNIFNGNTNMAAILHGKMSNEEKEFIMQNYKDGKIKVLVSTTVVEVGVNVPNATVMVVENAERFGLAQLHQLRGRVGRGNLKSYCILISDATNKESIERLNIMTKTNDGFVISEKDLELRGTGELFGLRQHGLPDLKIADILKDIEILKTTKDLAKKIIEENIIDNEEFIPLKNKINFLFKEKIDTATFN
ncbi:ATP-dependent DNA helicase RecG [Caloramator proteoclasticus]|uniref:ATP-dependent DNA helicase RecG n=1 Tax=Caloramator proteoclasticus DSM 10124 TaxID=1121262 RepID=A0A1M5B171_9CLOT|nr:ATP-dependent DNA helicase RecG [Caloramator proteoclasticus]SHF35922.1 ATP-dependent DNA helicase RecG [Caloramator proteoclasticus DSM 10124]